MDAALLLAALASRAGDRVDFLAYDRRYAPGSPGAARTELLSSLVNAMAPIEPELVEADAPGMVAAVLPRAERRCLVVLLTDLNPAALEEGLLPVLPQLTARHLVLVAAVSDPRVAAMAAGRGDAAAGLRRGGGRARRGATGGASPPCCAGTASRWWTRRPEDIAPALADAYLALKAAGRL